MTFAPYAGDGEVENTAAIHLVLASEKFVLAPDARLIVDRRDPRVLVFLPGALHW
jgi:hypothetical protein